MRRTRRAIAVALALLDDPQGRHWGYPLSKQSGVPSGVLYPILARMLDEGWLTDHWEDASTAAAQGRPPRRYYRLTPKGIVELGGMVESEEMSGSITLTRAGSV